MADNHSIKPTSKLVHEWHKKACQDPYNSGTFVESKTLMSIATDASQWGADQELEACVQWLETNAYNDVARKLRNVRRPSLKQQALKILDYPKDLWGKVDVDTIRQALEALPDD
jgi:hypothetical protein